MPPCLTLLSSDSDKDKQAVSKEKANLKIDHKHNKEGLDSDLIEDVLREHLILRALERQARLEIIKEVTNAIVARKMLRRYAASIRDTQRGISQDSE